MPIKQVILDIEIEIPPEISDDQVNEAIDRALETVASLAFDLSQELCPVRTGHLKSTGRAEVFPGGFTLVYTAPYAEVQDEGRKKEPITGEQNVYIEEYTRITEKGYEVIIPAHYRLYVNSRVIPIQTATGVKFRVIHEWPEIKGTGFITRAMDEAWAQFGDILNEEILAGLPPGYGVYDQ